MAKISETASPTGERAGSLVDDTCAALRVLVDPYVDEIDIKPKAGSDVPRVMLRQKAIMIGGARELNYAINVGFGDKHEAGALRQKTMQGGVYILSNKCFKLDDRGDLTFKAWADDYVFLREMDDAERAKFRPVQTKVSDIFPERAA